MADINLPNRQSTRLRGYDYAQAGAYFVTICTAERRPAFGRFHAGELQLHPYGYIAAECWQRIPEHYPTVVLDEWIVMPDHFHGIIVLATESSATTNATTPARFSAPQSGSLSIIFNRFKGATTRAINRARAEKNLSPVVVWQSRFHDRIIRDEKELDATRLYIATNPARHQAS